MRGSKLFEYDFNAFSIGTAEHPLAPTGCTVFRFNEPLKGVVDIRGGAAAVSDVSSLSLDGTWGQADGLVFSGGSTYGLAAVAGAQSALMNTRKSNEFGAIPTVPGAIVYDFVGRTDTYYPDATLGREAWESAIDNQVWIGARGAGRNVTVGKIFGLDYCEPAGQGAAFSRIGDLKFFALSVVNAAGCILDRKGDVVAGHLDPLTGRRSSTVDALLASHRDWREQEVRGNTTLTVLFTNARLDRSQLHRLCVSSHNGLGRVIEPYGTAIDGDVFFAFTTDEVALPQTVSLSALSAFGARVSQDAVLSAIDAVRD